LFLEAWGGARWVVVEYPGVRQHQTARLVGGVAALCVLVGACGENAPSSEETAVSTTSTSVVATTSSVPKGDPPVLADDQSGCVGLSTEGPGTTLTWIAQNELRWSGGCIVRLTEDVIRPVWDPTGRVLFLERDWVYRVTDEGENIVDEDRRPDPAQVVDAGDTYFVVRSDYDGSAEATWTGEPCGLGKTTATRGGRELRLAGTPVESMDPDRWMPDGTLLFVDRRDAPCEHGPGTLWSFDDGRIEKIADEVIDTAVRIIPPA
jgi:hypothetical protein